MELYDKEHMRKLRKECASIGIGYISDKGLIGFDKAVRLQMKAQLNKK
jgi:hypothetical protein